MNINTNNYSISEILGMLDRRELLVNSDYQRGSGLWPPGPSSYFIDTILGGYPFPKIYMYEFMNRAAREIRKEIVDGQQRIKTIVRFKENEFALSGDSPHAGKKFKDLDEEIQDRFLSYAISVDVIRNASHADILQMFRRMNAYTLPLNEAEKRHSSFQGRFKWAINDLSDELNEFFLEFGVFTRRQIIRMADAELISDCILAIEKGVVSTSPSDLTSLYKSYDDEFDPEGRYIEQIKSTVAFITSEFGNLRGSYMMKPYALHSLITSLLHCRYGIPAIEEKFGARPTGTFSKDVASSAATLIALAQAHEAKEEEGPYRVYAWGCLGGTNRAPRRTARVAAILRALGADVPAEIDANLT